MQSIECHFICIKTIIAGTTQNEVWFGMMLDRRWGEMGQYGMKMNNKEQGGGMKGRSEGL